MSSFPPAQYIPKKLFTTIYLNDNNRNFQRPVYKLSPLNSNPFNNRPVINQGSRIDFIPTSLTVPHKNQFNVPMAPNNPINIIPKLNNLQSPFSQGSIAVKGNITPRVVVPFVSNNNIINNKPVVGSNMNLIPMISVNNNINPINNLKMVNINNTPNQIPPSNNASPDMQGPKIFNMKIPPNINMINMNQPLPPKIVNVNPSPPITPIIPLNNIPITNPNSIIYPNSYIEPGKQINLKEFELLNEIGKGSFGNIYKVKWKVNQKYYALKAEILDDPNEISSRLNRGIAMRNFVQSTGCQGVVNIFGSHIIKIGPTIQYFELMELCDGDFEREIKMRSNYGSYYSEGELDNIMKQLISTLSFLQNRHITHRDIKPQNILMSNGKYKLCDFGDIRVMQRDGYVVQRIRGSELYMSPILFNALRSGVQQVQHNTYKSDVFSLGMCLFYAACLSYDGPVEIREVADMNMKLQILNKYLGARYSQKLIKILYLMLLTEESIRPDFIMLEDAILKYGL